MHIQTIEVYKKNQLNCIDVPLWTGIYNIKVKTTHRHAFKAILGWRKLER
jgi:hypothetical protein